MELEAQVGVGVSQQPPQPESTNNCLNSYLHRHYGNFYYWYYIIAFFIVCSFGWMLYNVLLSHAGTIALISPIIWIIFGLLITISFAASSKYLQVSDCGSYMIIEFGPFHNPLLCNATVQTIDYNDIVQVCGVDTALCTYCVKFVSYDEQKRIKFMMQGNMCDCFGDNNVNYDIVEITLTSRRCAQYGRVRFTTDDINGLFTMLRNKGVNVSDQRSKPCCFY